MQSLSVPRCSSSRPHLRAFTATPVSGSTKRISAGAPVAAAAAAAKAPQVHLQHKESDKRSSHNALVELQRLALEAQAEKDMWEMQISQHELQQQQLRAQLDARARHQAQSRAALDTLRHLLHAARHVTKEQHLAVFAESVHHCGRQRLRGACQEEREEHQAFVQASLDASEQLQDYDATLTRMVGAVMSSMAAAESLPLSLPALVTGQDNSGATQQAPALAPVVVAAGRNNIVPRKLATAALLQRRAAGHA